MDYLSDFRKQHSINEEADLSSIKVAVECIAAANKMAFDYISKIDTESDIEHFKINAHLNLIGRIFEQVEGMLSALATNCPTSSEALGRIVIEGSVNLMYMSKLGDEKTLFAFFSAWINEHQRKLSEWSEKVKDKSYSARVQSMIAERVSVVNFYKDFVQQGVDQFNVDEKDFPVVWPKSIFNRFAALGMEEAYYENYHRLSGASHVTAEDTIVWLVSLNFDEGQRVALAKEAWSYSIMMSRLSCLFFIDALAFSCIHFGLVEGGELNKFLEFKAEISKSVQEISEAAGVPRV